MTSWKIGSVFNAFFGITVLLFIIFSLTGVIPDSNFGRHVRSFIDRTYIFDLGAQHWWKFLMFIAFVVTYFINSVGFPLYILNKSVEQLDPEKSISIDHLAIYAFFGLFTPGGIFFFIGMFFIRRDLWTIRERKFRDVVESMRNGNYDVTYDEVPEEYFDENESYLPIQEPISRIEREEPREREFDSTIVKKVDRLERRLDDVEDDLYHQKRKTRTANKVLDNIQDALDNR